MISLSSVKITHIYPNQMECYSIEQLLWFFVTIVHNLDTGYGEMIQMSVATCHILLRLQTWLISTNSGLQLGSPICVSGHIFIDTLYADLKSCTSVLKHVTENDGLHIFTTGKGKITFVLSRCSKKPQDETIVCNLWWQLLSCLIAFSWINVI